MSIINRYHVKNPTFLEIEDISKKHVYEYNESFGFHILIWEWILDSDKVIKCVKLERKCILHSFWDLRRYLISKVFILKGNDINFLIYVK